MNTFKFSCQILMLSGTLLISGLFLSPVVAAQKTVGTIGAETAKKVCADQYWKCAKNCDPGGRLCSAGCDREFKKCTGATTRK
jgi:hypothetical protein